MASAFAFLAFGLITLILTTTFPYALASGKPALALRLNPKNPAALLAEADQLREDLVRLIAQRETLTSSGVGDGQRAELDRRVAALKTGITELAERLRRHDPYNARAYRLLAGAADDPAVIRTNMEAAVARSRRERTAMFWLIHASYERDDPASLLAYADMLMRSNTGFARRVTDYLIEVQQSDGGRERLIAALAAAPPWRPNVLATYAARTDRPAALIALLQALDRSAAPATPQEVATIINTLFERGAIAPAHALWQRRATPGNESERRLLTNGDFESRPSGFPFDWRFGDAVNAIVEITGDSQKRENRALHLAFSGRRARGIDVSQVIMVEPGGYELTGRIRGRMTSKRGLRWQLHCLSGEKDNRTPIATSEQIATKSEDWRPWRFAFSVPSDPGCAAQRLTLIHDARSASERIVSGEAWLDDLALTKLSGEPAVAIEATGGTRAAPALSERSRGKDASSTSSVLPNYPPLERRFDARPAGP